MAQHDAPRSTGYQALGSDRDIREPDTAPGDDWGCEAALPYLMSDYTSEHESGAFIGDR